MILKLLAIAAFALGEITDFLVPVDFNPIPNRYIRAVGGSGDGDVEGSGPSGDGPDGGNTTTTTTTEAPPTTTTSPCNGPTAYEDSNGDCACADIRGMTQSGDVCMCDSSMDFEWNGSECVCTADTQPDFLGDCSTSREVWQRSWSSCKYSRRLGTYNRKRRYSLTSCSLDGGASAAPWFDCDKNKGAIREDCNTNTTFFCNDWNSEYDTGTGVCECKSGYTATKWGCIRTWTSMTDAMDEWRSEVWDRLNSINAASTWPKLTSARYNRLRKRLGKLANGVKRKYKKRCGKQSVAANPISVSGIETLYDDFNTYAAMSDDVSALTNLVQWMNGFMKYGIYNCGGSGYGNDPNDGATDANGVTCSQANKNDYFKCRLQTRLAANYKGASDIDLDFS